MSAGMSPDWHDRTRWLTPFMQSPCISCELLMIDNVRVVKKLADYINMLLQRGVMQVAGRDLRATVETSPRRREHLRQWFQARGHLSQLNPTKEWAVCERALEVWNKRMSKRIGYRDASTGCWTWNRHSAAQEGLKVPDDFSEQAPAKDEMPPPDEDMKDEGAAENAEGINADEEKDAAATPRDGQMKHAAEQHEQDKDKKHQKTLTRAYSAPTDPTPRPQGGAASSSTS